MRALIREAVAIDLEEQRRAQRVQPKPKKKKLLQRTETAQQRELRLALARAGRKQLRERFAADDDAILSFKEWAALNNLSERQGRRILHEPGGPVVTKISTRRSGSRAGIIGCGRRRARVADGPGPAAANGGSRGRSYR